MNNLHVCERCNQLSFTAIPKRNNGIHLCEHCYLVTTDLFSHEEPENLVVKIMIDGCLGEETILSPFTELCDKYVLEYDSESLNVIRNKFKPFGVDSVEMSLCTKQDLLNEGITLGEIEDCIEFEIPFYIESEHAHENSFYARPFDLTPEGGFFSCDLAVDCYEGRVYSKDFSYFTCDFCNRTICEQNPSNGWHSQMHWINDQSCACNKCIQEELLEKGLKAFDNYISEFFSYSELESHGWIAVHDFILGEGRFGQKPKESEEELKAFIDNLIDLDIPVLVNCEAMAIGGLGGEYEIYIKRKDYLRVLQAA